VTPARSLARSALYLVIGQAATMVLGVLFNAALGRTLGAGDFGLYFLISTFATFALLLVDWGQQIFGIREVARSPARGGDLLGTGLVLRILGTALACLLTALCAWALGYDTRTIGFASAFVALNLPFFLAQNFGIVFRGHDRMGLDAAVAVCNRAAGLVLALAALWLGLGLGGVVVSQGLAGVLALLLGAQLYRRVSVGPLRFSRATAREILAGGTTLLVMVVAVSVQPYIDAVLLSKLVPKDAVGWYGAARSIIVMLNAPALILGAAALPRLSRVSHDPRAFREEMAIAERPMVWMAGLGTVGTWLFADVVIRIVYGHSGFAPAGAILSVFGLGLFLVFVDSFLATVIIALGRTASFSVLKLATVVLATVLEIFLIPYFQQRSGNGGLGVITSFVVCEPMIFAGMLLLIPRGVVGRTFLLDGARAIGSAAVTGMLLRLVPTLPPWVAIPACIALYTATSLAVGLLRAEDVRGLVRLFARELGSIGPSAPVKGSTTS
jgi:O-antigen/teichoic acid export membrane protein